MAPVGCSQLVLIWRPTPTFGWLRPQLWLWLWPQPSQSRSNICYLLPINIFYHHVPYTFKSNSLFFFSSWNWHICWNTGLSGQYINKEGPVSPSAVQASHYVARPALCVGLVLEDRWIGEFWEDCSSIWVNWKHIRLRPCTTEILCEWVMCVVWQLCIQEFTQIVVDIKAEETFELNITAQKPAQQSKWENIVAHYCSALRECHCGGWRWTYVRQLSARTELPGD